jgi:hypothetical protein
MHYIDRPCIDMPRFRLHQSLPHIDMPRIHGHGTHNSYYVKAPSRHVFHFHLSFTLSTQDLSLQIQALSRDLPDHTSLIDTSLLSLLQGSRLSPVSPPSLPSAFLRIQSTSTSSLYKPGTPRIHDVGKREAAFYYQRPSDPTSGIL